VTRAPADEAPGRVRERLLADHAATIDAVLECADAAAWELDDGARCDGTALAAEIEATLERRGILGILPGVLVDAVTATGRELAATPVPAPPYVAITSRGPVLRATLADGRLVVTIEAFAAQRDPPRYVRTAETPTEALSVAFHPGG